MRLFLLLTFWILASAAPAQQLQLKNFHLGSRTYEMEAVGNNPLTIGPLMQDQENYEDFVSTIPYNGIWGAGGIQWLKTFYLNTEWHKPGTSSGFWKKHSLQAGLLVTGRLSKPGMSIGQEGMQTTPDTAFYRNVFTVTQQQQFFGANGGINRRFRIVKGVSFVAGLHLQGSFALLHRYRLRFDSTLNYRQTRSTTTTPLPDREGKQFFQWQAGVPLGFEISLYKKQVFLRPELALGIVGSKYRPRSPVHKEAHGFGIWLIYQPR